MPKTPRKPPRQKVIEILAFDDVQVLDVTGAMQVFAYGDVWARERGHPSPYNIRIVARHSPVRAWSGFEFTAQPLTRSDRPVDTLMMAGGLGVEQTMKDARLLRWVRERASHARRVASVCSGAFLLAAAGLLDGRRVVTHWRYCDALAQRFPKVSVDRDPIYIEDGRIWTSAGVTAGIDMSLAMIERDLGHDAAMFAARSMVVYLKRPGGQSQFSAILQLQTGDERLDRLNGWVADHLEGDLSVPALADRAGMSERSFIRHYRKATGLTPARAVEQIRVEAARELLSTTALPVKRVAHRCGFGSEETMRRSFLRQISVSPQDYRRRFGTRPLP